MKKLLTTLVIAIGAIVAPVFGQPKLPAPTGPIGVAIHIPHLLVGVTPGTIPETFAVAPSGAATYSVPIAVPPGVAGLQPHLSLVYDSSGGNGLLGMGFSLSGLPAITRGRREIEPDGAKGAITYDQDDRFFLDGQRLIATGRVDYTASGQHYRTEIESFQDVTAIGAATAGSPIYFEVRTRDGLTMSFGSTDDSRIQVADMNPPVTMALPQVRVWALSQVTDRFGNVIVIHYDKDPSELNIPGIPNGSYRPLEIDYGQNSVKFSYENRPDLLPASAGGYIILETKRLKQIRTYTDNQLVFTYGLAYTSGLPTGRSQLASLTLTGGAISYPSTTFAWQNGGAVGFTAQTSLSLVQGVQTDFASFIGSLSGPLTYYSQGASGMRCDVNGDGKDDLVLVYRDVASGQERVRVLLSSGTGFVQSSDNVLAAWDTSEQESFFLQGDVNGDGKTDLIQVKPYNGATYAFVRVANAAGTGFDAPLTPVKVFDSPISFQSGQTYPSPGFPQFQTADVDGDGRTDLVLFIVNQFGAQARALLSTGSGFATYTTNASAWTVVGPSGTAGPQFLNKLMLLDMNGDGKTDLASIAYNAVIKVYQFNGQGFVTDGTQSSGGQVYMSSVETQYYVAGDFNGDGNMDLAHVYASSNMEATPTKVIICLSDGKSKFYPQQGDGNPCMIWPTWNAANEIIPGDFDGDGRTDLMFVNRVNNTAPAYFYRSITDSSGKASLQKVSNSPLNLGAAPPLGTRFLVADFSGDGKSDILNLQGFNLPQVLSWPWGCPATGNCASYVPAISGPLYQTLAGNLNANLFFSTGPATDLMTQVTNGLGLKHAITYRPLTSDVYTGANATNLGSEIYDSRPPFPVVSTFTVSDGIGGDQTYTMQYAGAKYHRLGRGSLGFQMVTQSKSIPSTTGKALVTMTKFAQVFPLTGRPLGTLTFLRPQAAIPAYMIATKLDSTVWASVPATASGPTVYRVHANSEEGKTFDFGSGSLAADDTAAYAYDLFDNPLVTTMGTIEGYTEVISAAYFNDPVTWRLGLVTSTAESHTGPGGTLVHRRSYSYSTQGTLVNEVIEPLDTAPVRHEHAFSYDAFGNLTEIKEGNAQTAPLRLVEQTTFDPLGRFPVQRQNGLGQVELLAFDHRFGKITQDTDPNGIVTATAYDGMGRPASVTTPEGVTTWDFSFDNYGDPAIFPSLAVYSVFKTAPLAPTVETFYDVRERAIRTRTLGFDSINYVQCDTQYDALGRVLQRSRGYYAQTADPVLWTGYQYDDIDRVIKKTLPDNSATQFQYDFLNGTRVTTTDALNQATVITRDSLSRVISKKDTLGQVTTYGYDSFGELITLTEPGGIVTTLTYDPVGRRTSIHEPNAGTWQFRYNVFGNVDQLTDGKMQVFAMEYDGLNRLVKRTDPNGAVGQWTYDAALGGIGRLTGVSGPNHFAQTYSYDALSRLIKEQRTIDVNGYDGNPANDAPIIYATSYTYVQNSRLVEKEIFPVKSGPPSSAYVVAYSYSAAGYLQTAAGFDGATSAWPIVLWKATAEDAQGELLQARLNDGKVLENYSFNDGISAPNRQGTLRRIEITSVPVNQPIFTDDYSYDPVQDLVIKVTQSGSATQQAGEKYVYDGLRRVIKVTSQQGTAVSVCNYGYDARGNILNKSDVGGYVYGSATLRPHAVAATNASNGTVRTFSYDANGNLTSALISGTGETIAYTPFNRPEQITDTPLNAGSTMRYDPDRNLVLEARAVGGALATRIVGGKDYEALVDGQNHLIENHYVHVGARLIAVYRRAGGATGQTLFLHQDRLGSVEVVTDQANAELERLSYDASGRRRPYNLNPAPAGFTATSTDRGFTGHFHQDYLGLINMGARVYDPRNGLFLTVDPLRLLAPERAQPYGYAWQNPVRSLDPTGLDPTDDEINKLTWQAPVEVFSDGQRPGDSPEDSNHSDDERRAQFLSDKAEREAFRESQLPKLWTQSRKEGPADDAKPDPTLGAVAAIYALSHPDFKIPPLHGPTTNISATVPLSPYQERRQRLINEARAGDEAAQYMLYVGNHPWYVVLLAPNNPDATPLQGNGPLSGWVNLDVMNFSDMSGTGKETPEQLESETGPYGDNVEWSPIAE